MYWFFIIGAIGTSLDTVFGATVEFSCPEGQVFATGNKTIFTECTPGGQWSQAYIPKCQVYIDNDVLQISFHIRLI